MTRIRLLPVVVLAVAALLLLKTVGLITHGGYVLTGIGAAQASGASSGGDSSGTTEADHSVTPAAEPTLEDSSPTLSDAAPTLGAEPAAAAGGHGAPAAAAEPDAAAAEAEHATPAAEGAATPVAATTNGTYCVEADATLTESGETILLNADAASGGHGATAEPATETAEPAASGEHGAETEPAVAVPEGSFAATMIDCLPSGDAVPTRIGADGNLVPLGGDTASASEQQLLDRLVQRRSELQQYEQDLALRASIVDAAEQRIEERATTLQALESQISTLVDQRQQMETGQFAGIVAMYENMRPKDAATIFNNLDMSVLLQVAKTMSPRKMAPILAAMQASRAQELTVQMANLADRPPTEMSQEDLAALPQIVGQ